MKKYIRTKTEIKKIETTLNNKELFDYLLQFSNYKDNLIAVADTIEELCDVFVVKDNDCGLCYLLNDESKYAIQYHIKDQIDILVNDFKMQNDTCYGAIWTDKGLIYVAKMNDKGELELLWQSKNK